MRILNIRMGRLHVYAMTIFGLLIAGCTKEDRPESQVSETVKSFCLQWFPNERIIASERPTRREKAEMLSEPINWRNRSAKLVSGSDEQQDI